MGKNKKTENLDLLHYVLKRPAMFSIHNVELFNMFFQGYLIGKEENVLIDYLDSFSDFVRENFSNSCFSQFSYERIIRLHSMNDNHSLELLNQLIFEFEKQNIVR